MPAWKITRMIKAGIRGCGIMRLVTLVIVLLFAPLTTSATGFGKHAADHSAHAATVGDHCADHCLGMGERLDSPAKTPVHCHLKSPRAQASGLSQAPPAESDPQLLALNGMSHPVQETATRLPAAATHVPIVGLPRFILFGSFRS